MTQVLYATFADPEMAEKAVGALLDNGVEPEHVSLVFSESYRRDEEPTREAEDVVQRGKSGVTTTTPSDVVAGAAKGAGVGLGIGTLAALASLFVPGIGLVTGGGALATALISAAGTTAAGAVAGSITGYLVDQGMSEETAARYKEILENDGAMIAIQLPPGELPQATIRQILSKYQGADFSAYST